MKVAQGFAWCIVIDDILIDLIPLIQSDQSVASGSNPTSLYFCSLICFFSFIHKEKNNNILFYL